MLNAATYDVGRLVLSANGLPVRLRNDCYAILRGVQMRWIALVVFLLAAGVRSAVWLELRGDDEFDALVGDSRQYDQWSRDIAAGDWLSRRESVFYQAPLYPYFLAAHRVLFGENALTAARATQLLLGSLGAAALALAAFRLSDSAKLPAWLAGTLMAIWPAAIFFDLQVDKATLDGFLVCLIMLGIATFQTRPRWLVCVMLGAGVGVLTLNRENGIILLAVLLPMAFLGGRRWGHQPVYMRRWMFPAAMLVAFLAVVLPVSIRNSLVGGEFHLVTSQFGPNFYIGNGAGADGIYRPLREGRGDPRFERTDATEIAQAAAGRTLSPREVSRYWTRRTLSDIASDPLAWLGVTARKFVLVFHAAEVADNNDINSLASGSWVLWGLSSALTPMLLLLLLVGAAARLWHVRERVWPVIGCGAAMAMTVTGFYVFARYRYCMVPMMILALASLTGLRAARRISFSSVKLELASASALILVVLMCYPSWTLPPRVCGVADYNYALGCDRRGWTSAAASGYERAIKANPELVQARNNLGLIYAARQDYDRAVAEFEAVLKQTPNDAIAANNLGMALGGQGKLIAAAGAFERAVALDPQFKSAAENLAKARALLEARE